VDTGLVVHRGLRRRSCTRPPSRCRSTPAPTPPAPPPPAAAPLPCSPPAAASTPVLPPPSSTATDSHQRSAFVPFRLAPPPRPRGRARRQRRLEAAMQEGTPAAAVGAAAREGAPAVAARSSRAGSGSGGVHAGGRVAVSGGGCGSDGVPAFLNAMAGVVCAEAPRVPSTSSPPALSIAGSTSTATVASPRPCAPPRLRSSPLRHLPWSAAILRCGSGAAAGGGDAGVERRRGEGRGPGASAEATVDDQNSLPSANRCPCQLIAPKTTSRG